MPDMSQLGMHEVLSRLAWSSSRGVLCYFALGACSLLGLYPCASKAQALSSLSDPKSVLALSQESTHAANTPPAAPSSLRPLSSQTPPPKPYGYGLLMEDEGNAHDMMQQLLYLGKARASAIGAAGATVSGTVEIGASNLRHSPLRESKRPAQAPGIGSDKVEAVANNTEEVLAWQASELQAEMAELAHASNTSDTSVTSATAASGAPAPSAAGQKAGETARTMVADVATPEGDDAELVLPPMGHLCASAKQVQDLASHKVQQDSPLLDPVTGFDAANYQIYNPKFAVKSWITDPAFAGFAGYFLQPADYGQSYIGKLTLEEYAAAWRHYISMLPDHQKCYVFSGQSRFTVYGKDCLKVHSLERIEASANDSGKLSSVVLVQQLGEQIPKEVMLSFLKQRYRYIETKGSGIEQVADLADDLCVLSETLSNSRYQCTLNWFAPSQNTFMLYKHSRFNNLNTAVIMFGDKEYFDEVQIPLVKRRLAALRKQLAEAGIADPTATHK